MEVEQGGVLDCPEAVAVHRFVDFSEEGGGEDGQGLRFAGEGEKGVLAGLYLGLVHLG